MKLLFKNFIIPFLTVAILAVGLTSCKDEPQPPKQVPRTILVYMAANNSLGADRCDQKDIGEMISAARAGGPDAFGGGRLIVFHAPTDGSQTLCEIKAGTGEVVTLKTYPQDQYVVSASRMTEVMNDAKALAPADNYGLILWSHGYGWTQNGRPESRTWGDDRRQSMNISTLADVLNHQGFRWVYFDCCYMGSVEVLYQLRDATRTVVASASEIPLDGMPYEKNIPLFFAPEADLIGAADSTFAYYDNLKGEDRTCTIGVFNLRGMEQLAKATVDVYDSSTIVTPQSFPNLPLSTDSRPLFYDFGVYVRGLAEFNELDSTIIENWNKAYGDVVLYQRATPMLWNRISLERFTGASTYLRRTKEDSYYHQYDTLEWYIDVASYLNTNLPDK